MKPPMSLDNSLSFEVKKEIADRYFGFRRLIEEDTLDLEEKIKQYTLILEKRISFDLIRIYILLHEKKLVDRFLALTGITEELFYDPWLTDSPAILKRVFSGIAVRGLTLAGRFKNLLFDCYARLGHHVEIYREKCAELAKARQQIVDDIDHFYRTTDLSTIMGFLRALDEPVLSGPLRGSVNQGVGTGLDNKMRIAHPKPIEYHLPPLPPLPPLATVKADLKAMANQSYQSNGPTRIRRILALRDKHPEH